MRSNYRAARRGRSHDEFKAKLGVVFEEADEAADWLRYFRDTGMRHDAKLVQAGPAMTLTTTASGRRRSDSREKHAGG